MSGFTDWKAKFWSYVVKSDDPKACWIWTHGTDKDGYGIFGGPSGACMAETGERRAHRISFVLNNGFIDEDLMILHKCNNPPCINPFHLYKGTGKQNADDRERSGHHGIYKLTLDDAAEMRRLYSTGKYTHAQIAEKFSISRAHAQDVIAAGNGRYALDERPVSKYFRHKNGHLTCKNK